MRIFILLIMPFLLFAFNEQKLAECYKKGDLKCGLELAYEYKKTNEKKAATLFLDLSLKGSIEATRELAMIYIYGKEQNCRKGAVILLNAAINKESKESIIAYKDISELFKKGICVKKDLKKSKKYMDIYIKKAQKLINQN